MARQSSPARSAESVRVVQLPEARDLPLPAYQTDGAAGLDLVAAVPQKTPIRLKRGAVAMIPTGLILEIPTGYEAQVRPRSGLAAKHGVTVLNSPGTIDSDYRGEVQVILINHGSKTFTVQRGERIAQIVFAAVTRMALMKVETASSTGRGSGGFGSTGVMAAGVAKPAAPNIIRGKSHAAPKAGKKPARATKKPVKAVKTKSTKQGGRTAKAGKANALAATAFPRRPLSGTQIRGVLSRRR